MVSIKTILIDVPPVNARSLHNIVSLMVEKNDFDVSALHSNMQRHNGDHSYITTPTLQLVLSSGSDELFNLFESLEGCHFTNAVFKHMCSDGDLLGVWNAMLRLSPINQLKKSSIYAVECLLKSSFTEEIKSLLLDVMARILRDSTPVDKWQTWPSLEELIIESVYHGEQWLTAFERCGKHLFKQPKPSTSEH